MKGEGIYTPGEWTLEYIFYVNGYISGSRCTSSTSGKPSSAIRSHLCYRAQIRFGRSPEVQLLPHRPR